MSEENVSRGAAVKKDNTWNVLLAAKGIEAGLSGIAALALLVLFFNTLAYSEYDSLISTMMSKAGLESAVIGILWMNGAFSRLVWIGILVLPTVSLVGMLKMDSGSGTDLLKRTIVWKRMAYIVLFLVYLGALIEAVTIVTHPHYAYIANGLDLTDYIVPATVVIFGFIVLQIIYNHKVIAFLDRRDEDPETVDPDKAELQNMRLRILSGVLGFVWMIYGGIQLVTDIRYWDILKYGNGQDKMLIFFFVAFPLSLAFKYAWAAYCFGKKERRNQY